LPILEALSFLISIVGICVLTEVWNFQNYLEWKGTVFLLLSAFSWAVGILCSHHMTWHRPSIQLLPWQLLLGTICTIGVAWSQDIPLLPNTANPIFIGSLLYTGIIGIAIGYWVLISLSKHLIPSRISLGLLFVPISSMSISVIFLHEPISMTLISGVILLIIASLLHVYSGKTSQEL
jgi:drug/metabolite transporter (DMT)-like permease